MRTPEGYEKEDIKRYFKKIGAKVIVITTMGYGPSGESDIIACYKGRFISIEVKREGMEPTTLQRRRIKATQEAGGFATWGTAKKVIGEIDLWRGSLEEK